MTAALTLIGLFLFLLCWFDSAVQASTHPDRKKGVWGGLQRFLCAFKGKYTSDFRIKVMGVVAVLLLLIGQASSAFAQDDPAFCENGPRGCSDYWKMQAQKQDDSYGEQLAKVIKSADGNVEVLELIVWGSVAAYGLSQMKHISRDVTRVQLAKQGKGIVE